MPYFVHSEGGYEHENEDVVEVRAHPRSGGVILCALADGMGGQVGGKAAAQMATRASFDLMSEFEVVQLHEEATWGMIVSGVDDRVSDTESAGYTTLVCLGVVGDMIVGASCGDSAALLLDGQGKKIVLTEEQRKNPAVGSGGALPITFSAALGREWQVVVMSDGVWKYLGWEAIEALAWEKRGFDLVLALRKLADERCGGKLWDDWSVAVITSD